MCLCTLPKSLNHSQKLVKIIDVKVSNFEKKVLKINIYTAGSSCNTTRRY